MNPRTGRYLIPALAWAVGQAASLPVVMVADVMGGVREGKRALTLAEGIPAFRELKLDPGARLTVIHLKSGEELVFQGPCTVRFDSEGKPQSAKPVSERKVAVLSQELRLKPGAWAQASVVIRKEVAVPSNRWAEDEPTPLTLPRFERESSVQFQPSGSAILETQPEFKWQRPEQATWVRLRLEDIDGKEWLNEIVKGNNWRLPLEKALKLGGYYGWKLSWGLSDGNENSVQGNFHVLTEAETATIRSLRPAERAPFSDRLVFAVLLETRGLCEEARSYWQKLTAERPSDATLKRFAGK